MLREGLFDTGTFEQRRSELYRYQVSASARAAVSWACSKQNQEVNLAVEEEGGVSDVEEK